MKCPTAENFPLFQMAYISLPSPDNAPTNQRQYQIDSTCIRRYNKTCKDSLQLLGICKHYRPTRVANDWPAAQTLQASKPGS